jgi:hypothetical protein
VNRIRGALSILGLALGLACAACGDGTYPFYARRYEPDRDCVETSGVVDVLRGKDPGSCEPRCATQGLTDGGVRILVALTCDPLPHGVEASPSHPLCSAALESYARKDTCLDGGSAAPRDAASD